MENRPQDGSILRAALLAPILRIAVAQDEDLKDLPAEASAQAGYMHPEGEAADSTAEVLACAAASA
ncbi:MAG: hypothetical protein Q7S05_04675 [bacterium]|nr:hypothetical protein [bacterium]